MACKIPCRKKYKKVTHVIFDMDGTLIDTEKVNTDVISSILKDFGKSYTEELQNKILGTPSRQVCQLLIDAGAKLTLDECMKLFEDRCSGRIDQCPLMPGVERLVRHFYDCKVPIAIATSSSKKEMNVKMARMLEFKNLFHHIVTGGSDPKVKRPKPAPDIYLLCAERFDPSVSPEKVLVFEDAPNGVRAARDAGMQVVMIPSPRTPTKLRKRATLVLESMDDFKPEQFGLPRIYRDCYCKTA